MKNFKKLLVMSLTVVAFLVAGSAAKADAYIAINLDSPYQVGAAGETLNFNANLENLESSVVYLNGDSLSVSGPTIGSGVTTTDYFFNTPLFLTGSGTSGGMLLFSVSLPNGAPFGDYIGTIDIYGGTGAYDYNLIGAETFEITYTPEPGTWVLLGTGLLLLAGLIRYRMPKMKQLTVA